MGRPVDVNKLIDDLKECLDEENIQHTLEYFGVYDIIRSQPTVEAKPVEWIPCSERLPEEEYERAIEEKGDSAIYPVLVTVETLSFEENRHINVVKQAWFFEMFDYYAFYDSDCHEVDVIAWMPLPEAYNTDMRGGKNE